MGHLGNESATDDQFRIYLYHYNWWQLRTNLELAHSPDKLITGAICMLISLLKVPISLSIAAAPILTPMSHHFCHSASVISKLLAIVGSFQHI